VDTPLPGGSLMSVAVPGVWNHRRFALGIPVATAELAALKAPVLRAMQREIAQLEAVTP